MYRIVFIIFVNFICFNNSYSSNLRLLDSPSEIFIHNCNNIKFNTTNFLASCKNLNGKTIENNLNLDNCLVNFNGKLLWTENTNGFYSQKCHSCSVKDKDTYLNCLCVKTNNSTIAASIDLKEGIINDDGKLKCKFIV
jgi:hypothetical protein